MGSDAQPDLAKLATAVAASGPPCWTLKGEGNANLVLAYTGTDPALVSQRTMSHIITVCCVPCLFVYLLVIMTTLTSLPSLHNPLVLGIK